jgi:hypothetical protein
LDRKEGISSMTEVERVDEGREAMPVSPAGAKSWELVHSMLN